MIAPVRTIHAIAAAPTTRAITPSDRADRLHEAVLVAACAAVDAVAAGILLLGTPPTPLFEGLAAAVLHGTAVLLLSGGLTGARPSRRWLCVAAVLTVPFAGAAVAAATLITRGRGPTAIGRHRRRRPRPALTMAALHRLQNSLSPYDALNCGDDEQRRAALVALSRREDHEAIALLRRTAAGRDPDLALSAALVLDEIGERAEREGDGSDPDKIRHDAGWRPQR